MDQTGLARKTLKKLAAVVSVTHLTLIPVQVEVLFMTSIPTTQLMGVPVMTFI